MTNDETEAIQARGTVLRVLTYNILAGGQSRLAAIEEVLRSANADLVGIQEALQPEALAPLAERLGMHLAIGRSQHGGHVAALSRWPILRAWSDDSGMMDKTMLDIALELPGGMPLRFFVVHLAARYNTLWAGEAQRTREVAHVVRRMAEARKAGIAHLLAGDFNSLAPGERLRASAVLRQALKVDDARAQGARMEGLPGVNSILPPFARPLRTTLELVARSQALSEVCDAAVSAYVPRRVVRHVLRAGYVDCYAATHPDTRTREHSCPAEAPAGRIDYIFADPLLARRLRGCEMLADAPGRPVCAASDHRPVLAYFRLGEAVP